MKITEKIVRSLAEYIEDKHVLEVACGDASFSLTASSYAKEVTATDIESFRIDRIPQETVPNNLSFEIMDASRLDFEQNTFDNAVCYNALSHLGELALDVTEEMLRTVKLGGKAIFIGTWKMENPKLDDLKSKLTNTNNYRVDEISNKGVYRALIISRK